MATLESNNVAPPRAIGGPPSPRNTVTDALSSFSNSREQF